MKSLLHSTYTFLLVGLVAFASSCSQEVVEPMQPATASYTEAARGANESASFKNGNYIVQFQNDSSLELNTNQDIENLANSIAGAQLVFTDVYNFEGYKGFTGYLTKQQARNFANDLRVLAIEPDSPIAPVSGGE